MRDYTRGVRPSRGTTDFSTILTKVRVANPDVLGGATVFVDAVAITRQMKALNMNPRMVGLTIGVDLPKFVYERGRKLTSDRPAMAR